MEYIDKIFNFLFKDLLEKGLPFAVKITLFLLLSIVFLPAFAVVHYCNKTWTSMLDGLFKL